MPEDVVITWFDNSIEAGGSPVSLTTIEQDYGTMAELALQQLQRRIMQDHAAGWEEMSSWPCCPGCGRRRPGR